MGNISRRVLSIGLLSTLATSIFPALAVEKPQIACRYLGQKTIHRGRIFTCVSSRVRGKKILAWDSGILIPATQPTPSPTEALSPSPTPIKTIEKIDIALASSSDVSTNSLKIFYAKNRFGNMSGYVVIRSDAGLIALSDICQHKGCSVEIQKEGLVCPCHNALFDSTSGNVLRGPATYPLDRIPVREVNGFIFVTD